MSRAPVPVTPLSILTAEPAGPQLGLDPLPVRSRLNFVLGVMQSAGLAYWVPAVDDCAAELRQALETLESIVTDAQAAPRSWLIERIEAEL